ncbi:hypothetical protein FACS1894120_1060 [Clostridia bacterium]|nr:hypothetical protein FACS1894120_1060 [Clostridia bacterium]
MRKERQRQGRDFPPENVTAGAELSVEGNYNQIDGIIGNAPPKDDSEAKKTIQEKLEYYNKIAELNALTVDERCPADGYDPPERSF